MKIFSKNTELIQKEILRNKLFWDYEYFNFLTSHFDGNLIIGNLVILFLS